MDTTSEINKARDGLRTQAFYMLGFLAIQFVLGMVTNLYVQFPDTNQADQLWATARSQTPTFAHIVLGILLLVGTIIFVVRAARNKNRGWIASSVAGLIGLIIAIYGGVMFTTTQVDTYSMVMALGFIAALVAYGWGLFAARG